MSTNLKTSATLKTSGGNVNLKTNLPYSPTLPLSIITSRSPFFYFSADVGVTTSGPAWIPNVDSWQDQSGNGNHATPVVGYKPRLYIDDYVSWFGGKSSVVAIGTAVLNLPWNPPAPATTNIWFFAVIYVIAYNTNYFLFSQSSSAGTLALRSNSSFSHSLQMSNGLPVNNVVVPLDTTNRLECLFTGSTNDYLKVGPSSTTGFNAGNNNAVDFSIFSPSVSINSLQSAIGCIGAWDGEPTSAEKLALDAWTQNYYSPIVLV